MVNGGDWGLQRLASGRQQTGVPILAVLPVGCGTLGHSHYLAEFQLPRL